MRRFICGKMSPKRSIFLLDDLYQGVIESFGRHRVRSWLVVGAEFGNKDITPTFAKRALDAVPEEGSLKQFTADEKQRQPRLYRQA